MNATNAVSTRTICNHCGALSQTRKQGERCDRRLDTISLGVVVCEGTYNITKGEQFKAQHGYSKTLKRNMKKHGLNPMEFSDSIRAYKEIRKKRKEKQTLVRKDKHSTAKAQRGSKSSTTKKK